MKVNITKNEFQTRKDEPNRVFHSYEGNIGDYTFTAETDSNGINGINKGSIYNLYISKNGVEAGNIARYDNKWEYRSKNTKDGAVRSAVIKYIDSISDKKDGEPKYKDGDMNEYSKGGNIIERRYVNKDQDYETRYAKDKPSRMGYKDERKFKEGGEMGKFAYGQTSMLKVELANNLRTQQGMNKVMLENDMPKSYVGDAMRLQARAEDLVKELKHRGVNIDSILYKDYNKFAVGGEVGNTVSFKGDYGTPRSGVVKEKRGSSYIVGTDDGERFVEPYEVISFSETPIAKKKRFGLFAEGGSIEEYKQAESDYDKYGEYLEDAIEDENEADIKKYKRLMDEAETKMHRYERKYEGGGSVESSMSILKKEANEYSMNKYGEPIDEDTFMVSGIKKDGENVSFKFIVAETVSGKDIKLTPSQIFEVDRDEKYAGGGEIEKEFEIYKNGTQQGYVKAKNLKEAERKVFAQYGKSGFKVYEVDEDEDEYAGGGEIENKIEKLKKVVSSKMLPESVKAKAKAEIDKLEKELENKMTGESEGERKAGMDKESKLDEKEELNATIQKLYGIESKAEDLINYQSGGIQGQSVDKIRKYVEYVNKEASKLDVPFGSEVFEVLQDENAHSLNLTLGLLGFYKNERDSGEWAKKHEQYTKLVDVVNEVKGGGKSEAKKEVVGYAIVDPISGEIVVSKKTIRQLIEASEKLEKTKGFEDMGDLAYEIIKKDDKNVLGDKIKSVDIKSLPIGKKPTTRKAPKSDGGDIKIKLKDGYYYNSLTAEVDGIEFHGYTLYDSNDKVIYKSPMIFDNRSKVRVAVNKKLAEINKKTTTRKAPVKKAVVKKTEVKGDLPKSKFEIGDKIGVSGHNEVYEIKDKSYRNNIEGELTWVYYLPEYSSVLVSEKNLKVIPKPKADHKKLLAKIKAKKGATPSNEPSKGHKRNESSDRKREAKPLGKRVSASGNKYYENRLNRGDISKEDKFEEGGEIKSSGWGLKFLNW